MYRACTRMICRTFTTSSSGAMAAGARNRRWPSTCVLFLVQDGAPTEIFCELLIYCKISSCLSVIQSPSWFCHEAQLFAFRSIVLVALHRQAPGRAARDRGVGAPSEISWDFSCTHSAFRNGYTSEKPQYLHFIYIKTTKIGERFLQNAHSVKFRRRRRRSGGGERHRQRGRKNGRG